MPDEKNTFSEDAKGFLNMLKNDYAEKNKDIIERKKLRDEETKALNDEIKKQFGEIKNDLSGTAKEIYDALEREIAGFTQALKEGTANVAQKLEIEKRMQQMETFLKATGSKSAEKFDQIMLSLKEKINSHSDKLSSEAGDALDNKKSILESEMNDDIDKAEDFFDKKAY